MHLPDFFKDPDLNSLRAQMGATELGSFRLAFNVYRFTISDLEQVVAAGITIDDPSKAHTLEDKTLAYKDRRVLLHIRDVHSPVGPGLAAVRWPVFHCCNCSIVRALRDGAQALVLTAREDGLFQIKLLHDGTERDTFERLAVCEQCLTELEYEGFSTSWTAVQRLAAVKRFDIARYFQRHGRVVPS